MKAVTLRTIYTRTRLVDQRGYIIFVGSLIEGKGDHTIVNSNDPAPAASNTLSPLRRKTSRLDGAWIQKKLPKAFLKRAGGAYGLAAAQHH